MVGEHALAARVAREDDARLARVQVAAGSVGLVVLGGLASVVSPYLLMLILGGCLVAALLALRGLPETARRDLVDEDRLGRTLPASA